METATIWWHTHVVSDLLAHTVGVKQQLGLQ